jgi:hypothetical protein
MFFRDLNDVWIFVRNALMRELLTCARCKAGYAIRTWNGGMTSKDGIRMGDRLVRWVKIIKTPQKIFRFLGEKIS